MTMRFDHGGADTDSFAPIALATRSGLDESLHFGAGVVLDESGAVAANVGDVDLVVYARSALKPMQADAMLRAGLTLSTRQLALACASHSGEAMHLELALGTLASVGLGADDLQNTPAYPYDVDARRAAVRAGAEKSSLQQNCSGKHAAMLATCQINGWPIADYLDRQHPVQRAITEHIAQLAGEPVAHVGIDGCGAPTHAISLRGLARAFATLARGSDAADAMRQHPDVVGGTGRGVTAWMTAVPGLIAKEGAAGVMAAALPNGRAVAYKIADGSDAACQAVMPEAIRLLGVDAEVVDRVAAQTAVSVLGHGEPVGQLTALPWAGRILA